MSSSSFTVIRSFGPPMKIPALLTRMSRPPSVRTVAAIGAPAATGATGSSWSDLITSTRPSAASIAAPVPRLPPVTTVVFPASWAGGCFLETFV